MKKLATKLTPAIKAWIKEEFGSNHYENDSEIFLFHFPNTQNYNGYKKFNHTDWNLIQGYTEVSESEFLAEFAKPKFDNTERVIQVRNNDTMPWNNRILLMFKKNKAICWDCVESIEEAKHITSTSEWDFWRELPTKETITIEKAEELLNFKYKIK